MSKKSYDRRRVYRAALIVLVAVFLFSAAFLFLNLWENGQGIFPAADQQQFLFEYQGKTYEEREGLETFLILGLDKTEDSQTADSYNNDRQADLLVLLVFDKEAKKCTALQINRDTMAQVQVLGVAGNRIDTVIKQIALAHTYGNGREVSCYNTAEAVSSLLLGVDVDHFISVTMDGVPVFNDLLGGVELTVLEDMTSVDPALVKGQQVTLRGQQALTYVRTRHGLEDSSNSSRMLRQQQYMEALQEKTRQCIDQDGEFLVNAAVKMADYIVSDRSVNQLQELARKFNTYEFCGIRQLQGENKVGERFMEFYPYEASLYETVIELFCTQKP